MAGSLSTAAGTTSIRVGPTCSATAADRRCKNKAVTGGRNTRRNGAGGRQRPMIFGNAYRARSTPRLAEPSRFAMPLMAVAPSARSTRPAATGGRQDDRARPDLRVRRGFKSIEKPPRPLAKSRSSSGLLTSVRALTPSPKRRLDRRSACRTSPCLSPRKLAPRLTLQANDRSMASKPLSERAEPGGMAAASRSGLTELTPDGRLSAFSEIGAPGDASTFTRSRFAIRRVSRATARPPRHEVAQDLMITRSSNRVR